MRTSFLLSLLLSVSLVFSQQLRLHYALTTEAAGAQQVSDQVGGYTAQLRNSAVVARVNNVPVVDLGSSNGYVDMGAATGDLIATLGDFTIATQLFIPSSSSISGNGNFVWTFANSTNMASTANGNLFFTANATRYAISRTHYSAEQTVRQGSQLPKGYWIQLSYTQSNSVGRIYIDGELVASSAITISPSALGATAYNFIGRSCYSGDAYLKGAMVRDFRIYDGALSSSQVKTLAEMVYPMNTAVYQTTLDAAVQALTMPDTLASNYLLPGSTANGVVIAWTSNRPDLVSPEGFVTRPAYGMQPAQVQLEASFSYRGLQAQKSLQVVVLPALSDTESVLRDAAVTLLPAESRMLYHQVKLPFDAPEGSRISWKSEHPEYINDAGKVLKLATDNKLPVQLTATFTKGTAETSRTFTAFIAPRDDREAYLFAYFTGNAQSQEQVRFAISTDGLSYTPLNGGNPVISSDTIAMKKAVRDPHILRGADGKTFYMVLTDMRSAEGWSSNRGLVMLKSTDLVNWQHARVHFPTRWPDTWNNVTRVWAPQTIYDAEAGKYLVYFSLLSNDGRATYDRIYYCYANSDFTGLEGEPRILFDRGTSTIDGDIVFNEVDGLYHLFFKNESLGGISKVTSSRLTALPGQADGSQWSAPSAKLQPTNKAVEGAGVFRTINSDEWILMYDCYTSGHYQFTSSRDLLTFSFLKDDYSIAARHGTTITLTRDEVQTLLRRFPLSGLSPNPQGSRNSLVRQERVAINSSARTVYLPVRYGTDLTRFDPLLYAAPGALIVPAGEQDFSQGAVTYMLNAGGTTVSYRVTVAVEANPVVEGARTEPDLLFSRNTRRFYLYTVVAGGVEVASSVDLVNWTNEGVVLQPSGGLSSPSVVEHYDASQSAWRYFMYYIPDSDGAAIARAVGAHPAGPFLSSRAIQDNSTIFGSTTLASSGASPGLSGESGLAVSSVNTASTTPVSVATFTDPSSEITYLYWNNAALWGVALQSDLKAVAGSPVKLADETSTGVEVFFRDGQYHFLRTMGDGTSSQLVVSTGNSPLAMASTTSVLMQQDGANQLTAPAHASVIRVPGSDHYHLAYQRTTPAHTGIGIEKMNFDDKGIAQSVLPTHAGIRAAEISEEVVNSVGTPFANEINQPDGWYTLQGIGIQQEDVLNGNVYIRVREGKAEKRIK